MIVCAPSARHAHLGSVADGDRAAVELGVVEVDERADLRTVGLNADVGQWALSLAGVGVLLPVHRTLRSWLDRQMFANGCVLTGSMTHGSLRRNQRP